MTNAERPVARVTVSALTGMGSQTLVVEPWGEEFDVAEGSHVIVTFLGTLTVMDPAEIEVSPIAQGVSVFAGSMCTDYLVTDSAGTALAGR